MEIWYKSINFAWLDESADHYPNNKYTNIFKHWKTRMKQESKDGF